MKLFIPQNLLSSASMTSTEHLRRDDVETRPSVSKIRLQMTDRPWISLIVDFGRNRQFRIPIASVLTIKLHYYYINTAIGILLYAMLNCYTAMLTDPHQPYTANFRLNPCRQRSVLFIEDARRAQATLSLDRSESKRQHLTIDKAGGRISIASHAKGSYPIPKISIGFHTLSGQFSMHFSRPYFILNE